MEIETLRIEVEQGDLRRDQDLRSRVIAAVHALHAQGEPNTEIGAMLGITGRTVARYLRRPGSPAEGIEVRQASLVRVVVPDESRCHGLVATTPGGFRVEGLSFEQVVALVRALS